MMLVEVTGSLPFRKSFGDQKDRNHRAEVTSFTPRDFFLGQKNPNNPEVSWIDDSYAIELGNFLESSVLILGFLPLAQPLGNLAFFSLCIYIYI